MFRSRFLLTAAVAVAAALVVPATSEATFSVTLTSGAATATVYDDNPAGPPGPNVGPFVDRNAPLANDIDVSSAQGGQFNGIFVAISSQTNSPGTASLGQLTETQVRLVNDATQKTIRIEIASDGFLSPTTPQLYIQTIVSGLGTQLQALVQAGRVSITSVVTPPGSPNAATQNTFTQGTGMDIDKWYSDAPLFTAATPYQIKTTIDFNLLAGESVFFNVMANVTPTPAPAGLVMFAGALPFAGLLRLRRRAQTATPTTAA